MYYENGNGEFTNSKPPKKNGNGPKIAIIIAVIFLGLTAVGFGAFAFLSSDFSNNISKTQQETTAEKDIGSTDTNTGASSYRVTDVSKVVEDAMPSVVAITSTTYVESNSNDLYDFYFGNGNSGQNNKKQEQVAAGSGFIVDQNNDELLIVTNNHVVEDSDKLAIQFYGQKNKETVSGTIKGTNESKDIAVVSVKMKDIPSKIKSGIKKATLGDSSKLKVGNGAIAIGNALGFGQSVTSGVISALDRTVEIENKKMTLIQTDAPINGGNSGGALLNQNGEVIGINVAKYSSSGSSGSVEGMGFAIPISSVKDEISKLEKQKSRTKQSEDEQGYLGIVGYTVDEQTNSKYGIPFGVYVKSVIKGEGADKAGIIETDVITGLEDKTIESMDDLSSALEYYKAGETVNVKVSYRSGSKYKSKNVKVTLGKKTEGISDSDNNSNSGSNNQDEYYSYGDDSEGDSGFSFPW